jgi:hypothetical protein
LKDELTDAEHESFDATVIKDALEVVGMAGNVWAEYNRNVETRQTQRAELRSAVKEVKSAIRKLELQSSETRLRKLALKDPSKFSTSQIHAFFRAQNLSRHFKQTQVPKGTRGRLNAERYARHATRVAMANASRTVNR